MRKLKFVLAFILVCNAVYAQDVSIPEGPFKTFLMNRYPGCFVNTDVNGFLMMNTACTAITTEDSLEFHNLGFIDLTGLEYFTSVIYLNCSNNFIQTYVYPPNLKYLDCTSSMADAPFGNFPPFPNSLEVLICPNNAALGIPFSTGLKYVDMSRNYCYSMSPLPNGLEKLICKDQTLESGAPRLTSLPALPASLKYLDCSSNQLGSLPALPASLDTLICNGQFAYNSPEAYLKTLTSLPALPASLKYLSCKNNALTVLPTLPSSLIYLDCSVQRQFRGDLYYNDPNAAQIAHEGISSLPTLPNSLRYLDCSSNKLTSLQATLPPTLQYLNVQRNVKVFDISGPALTGIQCLPRIPATLTSLNTSQTLINCYPNSGSYTASPVRPLCSPINNSNQCVSAPIIAGDIFYDNNSNGIKEPAENYRSFVEVNLSNGQVGYSDQNGHFELTGDIGSNTLTVLNPVNYASVPASRTYSIANYTDVVNDPYALQPTALLDSVRLHIATTFTARPGFTMSYFGEYENIGTTVVTPQLSFVFDNSRMIFNPASSTPGSTLSGNTVTIPGSLVGPGDNSSFIITFTVNPTAVLGDTIRVSASAVANTHVSTDSLFSVIRGAYDPNDKRATVSLTPQQVQQGAYVNYLVRFQNTGTDTAFNVVVTDALNGLIQPSSFQMLGSSHNCKVTRNGSTVYFEFLNILLPDSNINEPASHGWIRFRAKPIATIPLNSVIPNSVAIYFDYNAPVITNIANTTIALSPVPLTLLSFRGMTDASGKNALLTWETAEERNTSYFEIQSSNDGTRFEPVGNVQANGTGDGNYRFIKSLQQDITYFRLKMVDIDGRFTYSPVVKVSIQKPGAAYAILTNPVKQKMIIEVYDESLFNSVATIVDNSGRVVYSFKIKQSRQEVDVRNLATGIYYVRTNRGSQKILVSK